MLHKIDAMKDKDFRNDAIKRGLTVLRSQHDSRKNCWEICKLTRQGGWARFGAFWYLTQGDADRRIDFIVNNVPNNYIKDQNHDGK
jgi:hypothetical protein